MVLILVNNNKISTYDLFHFNRLDLETDENGGHLIGVVYSGEKEVKYNIFSIEDAEFYNEFVNKYIQAIATVAESLYVNLDEKQVLYSSTLYSLINRGRNKKEIEEM